MENSKDVYAHNRHAGASALCMKRRVFIHIKKVMNEKTDKEGKECSLILTGSLTEEIQAP